MNKVSLEQLYNQYKSQIYTLCMRLTMSKVYADELFSDTWYRVAEKIDQLDTDYNPINWIYTICINLYRKQKLKRSFIELFSDQQEYQNVSNSFENIEENEDAIQLQKALGKLPEKYRIPIVLFYFKDLSYLNISTIMNLPMSTIKFRLNQAKKLLKKEMEKR